MEFKTFLLITVLVFPGVFGETPGPKDNRSQIPIFLDQHMIKAISENIDNDKVGQPENIGTTQTINDRHIKDDNDMVTKNPAQVKEGNNEQVPIFMDQHMLNVVHRDMLKDNANDAETFEVTTEETIATEESPKEHQMPIFMNQQIVKEIVDLQKSRQQPDDLNHGDITTPQIPVRIPEPQENYKNSIYLEGHHHGNDWHRNLMVLLSSSMAQEISYGSQKLAAYPSSITWEHTSSGHEVTHVEYIVTYNGRVLAWYEVTHTLSKPRPSEYLRHGLQNMHLTQHPKADTQIQTSSQSSSKNTFMTPVLIAVVTLVVTILLLVFVVVIYVKRTRASPPKSKNKKELMKYILKADKRKSTTPVEPIKPPPYSENPAYEV